MNVYRLLKLGTTRSLPAPVKLLGLWGMLRFKRRLLGVFVDPTLGCNLRCRMCYFSDEAKRKEMHGLMDASQLELMEKLLLPYALKLQIGCGAEPTLYKGVGDIVSRGRRAGVPYISLTTNGQLIGTGRIDIEELIRLGLNEITLSLHGTESEIYENLMAGAKFDIFLQTVKKLGVAKAKYPDFVIRVNFTVNSLNIDNLRDNNFFELWDTAGVQPDIVQLRPVQKIGETSWTDFDLGRLKAEYDATIGNVIALCRERGIKCIAPTPANIDSVDDIQEGVTSTIEDITYCYVSPDSFYKPDFEPHKDTLHSYHRRKHTGRRLLKSILTGNKSRTRNISKKLNYTAK